MKSIQAADGTVVVTDSGDSLHGDRLAAADLSWLEGDAPSGDFECEAQIRYRHAAEVANVRIQPDGTAHVRFRRRVRAITPGQAVVFYDGDRVLGRGWILAAL